MNTLTAETQIAIAAPAAQVWDAITNPEKVKQYLYGTTVQTDWKEGSPISYEGEYNGKAYKDKGKILKIEPNKVLQSTYWSSMGGKEDKPENYNVVTYLLDEQDGKTTVTITQDNVKDEKEQEGAANNWQGVLVKLKEVVEGKVLPV